MKQFLLKTIFGIFCSIIFLGLYLWKAPTNNIDEDYELIDIYSQNEMILLDNF